MPFSPCQLAFRSSTCQCNVNKVLHLYRKLLFSWFHGVFKWVADLRCVCGDRSGCILGDVTDDQSIEHLDVSLWPVLHDPSLLIWSVAWNQVKNTRTLTPLSSLSLHQRCEVYACMYCRSENERDRYKDRLRKYDHLKKIMYLKSKMWRCGIRDFEVLSSFTLL